MKVRVFFTIVVAPSFLLHMFRRIIGNGSKSVHQVGETAKIGVVILFAKIYLALPGPMRAVASAQRGDDLLFISTDRLKCLVGDAIFEHG